MDKVSALIRDQKECPLDRAVYWIEYVIRHRGASHFRTAARKLSLYQRCLVDVSFLFFSIAFLLTYISYRLCLFTCHKVRKQPPFIQTSRKNGAIMFKKTS